MNWRGWGETGRYRASATLRATPPFWRLSLFVVFSVLLLAALLLEFNTWHWPGEASAVKQWWAAIIQPVVNQLPPSTDGTANADVSYAHLARGPEWLLALLWCVSAWSVRHQIYVERRLFVLAGLTLFIVLFDCALLIAWLPNTVITTGDTVTYWRFFPIRTAGYPALLRLFAIVSDGPHLLVMLQFLASGAATLLLAYAIISLFHSALMAVAVGIILTTKQGLIAQHLSLMTDSLFFSCCTAALALIFMMLRRPSWRLVTATAVVFAVAALLRPAVIGIALPFGCLALLFWWRGSLAWGARLVAAVSLGLCINFLAHPITAAVIGRPDAGAGNVGAFAMIATAGFLLTPDTPTSNTELRDRLVPEFAQYRQAWLDAGGFQSQFDVLLPQADMILFQHAAPVTCHIMQHPCRDWFSSADAHALGWLAFDAIRHDPHGMLRILRARLYDDAVWSLTGDWLLFQQADFAATNETYPVSEMTRDSFPAQHYRLQPTSVLLVPDLLGVASWFYDQRYPLNIFVTASCLLSVGFLVWSLIPGRDRSELAAVGIAGIGVLSYNLTVSFAQSPFGRYTDAAAAWFLVAALGTILLVARWSISFVRRAAVAAGAPQAVYAPHADAEPNLTASFVDVPVMIDASVDIAVLIPCYNEVTTIGKVIADFRVALPTARIYVYDNNSTDGTAAVVAATGVDLRHEPLQGKGNVVRRMFADISADIYVLVDGDDTYHAGDSARLAALLLDQTLDLVNGRRASDTEIVYRPGHRLGNFGLTRMVGFIFGNRLDDMLSGCKIMSRRFVKSFPCLSTGFEIETEIIVHALDLMMPLAEHPVRYQDRPAGSTSKLNTYRDGFRILRLILRLTRSEQPTLFFGLIGGGLALLAVILAIPLIGTYLSTGLVPRLPTAILSSSLVLLAFLSLTCGLLLEAVTRGRREIKRLAYLRLEAPASIRAGGTA